MPDRLTGLLEALGRALPLLVIAGLALVVMAACVPGAQQSLAPGQTPLPPPTPTPPHPLEPATPGADPGATVAWLFTPIFQAMFIALAAVYDVFHNLGAPGAIFWAIVAMTLLVRIILIPLYRRQLVSSRRMQMLQPELKEISRRYKGDRVKIQSAQQALYKERQISPLSGCLPILLQLPLLLIVYQVIQSGLTSPDPSPMLTVFGVQIISIDCVNPGNPYAPCMDTVVPILGDVSKPSVAFHILGIGISVLAIISAFLQLIMSRMTLPNTNPKDDDANTRTQRQMVLFLPLISVFFGAFWPAGLFIYWIVSSLFSIGQQFLIVGWGGTFPLFGWTPGFARDHTPRFPVTMPPPVTTSASAGGPPVRATPADRAASAAGTIRPRERGRSGRRGRRR
jgi:YidC/Oxa1 family membrane protein insertase